MSQNSKLSSVVAPQDCPPLDIILNVCICRFEKYNPARCTWFLKASCFLERLNEIQNGGVMIYG